MLPKHHKANHFLNTGLFDNLSDFAELEERISELPTTLQKGDAFEVFADYDWVDYVLATVGLMHY